MRQCRALSRLSAETACEQGPSSLLDQRYGGTDAERLAVQARLRQD